MRIPCRPSAALALIVIATALFGPVRASTDTAPAFAEPGSVLFVENAGQFDPAARFQVYGSGRAMWITSDGLWLTAYEEAGPQSGIDELLARQPRRGRRGVHLKVSFSGIRADARLIASEPADVRMNYFLGRDSSRWRVNLPAYRRVEWQGAYDGIDLAYTVRGGAVRIVVRRAPGTALDALRLRVEGGDAPRRDRSGRLVVDTAIGTVPLPMLVEEEHGPLAGDERRESPLVFSTLLGGSGDEFMGAVRAGPRGTVFVSGRTDSTEFPTTPGAFDPTYNSTSVSGDVFVAKFDRKGRRLVYSTFIGGHDTDNGMDLAVGPSGEAYIAGYTYSNDFPTTAGSYSPGFNGGCCDTFVAKLNAAGDALIYSTFIGGSSFEAARALAVGGDGTAYITGETLSPDFPTTPGAFDPIVNAGWTEAFVTALDPSGDALRYSTYLGGSDNDYGHGIATGPHGTAYVVGETRSGDFPTTLGAFDRIASGTEAFVTHLDQSGSRGLYSTYLGGSGLDSGRSIAVGPDGRACVSGHTEAGNFPTTPDAYDRSFNGYFDGFVACLGPFGRSLMFSTLLGGIDLELGGQEIALAPDGGVLVVGTTSSPDFPTTANAFDATLGGSYDAVVSKLSHDGRALLYSTFLGGSGLPGGLSGDWGDTISIENEDTVYVGGRTLAADFPTTRRAYDRTHAGRNDLFVTKLRIP